MRHNPILCIAFVTFFSCNAQTFPKPTRKQKKEYIQETKAFVKCIRTMEDQGDTILLVDKPNMPVFNDCIRGVFRDATLFTRDEQEAIKSQISHPALKKWDTKLVDKTNIISKDTINAIFKDTSKWWTYFYKHYGSSFNSYSAPIFLRNYTLCLFYSAHSCGGLCGSGQMTLFKKEGDTWKPVESFCNWIS